MDKRSRGLIGKFRIERTDGSDAKGRKHDGCDYFVLDITHDPFAVPALEAYADACEENGYRTLARDLRIKAANAKWQHYEDTGRRAADIRQRESMAMDD